MAVIQLQLPPEAKVLGALCDGENVADLDQDMVQIELPGEVVVDVGWYPDHDPHGEYRLIVFRGNAVEILLEPVLYTREINKIKRAIARLVRKYGVTKRVD